MKKIAGLIFNVFAFSGFFSVTSLIWWIVLAKDYIWGSRPFGGDYFNALTYANFFKDHIPLPPKGWIPFWNEGMPVIGGYPVLFFYLMQPLTKFLDTASSMEIFAATSLLGFFITSLVLFWVISRNWLFSFSMVLVLFKTRAIYYPLMTGGFIVAASSQLFLPLTLLFIYKFSEKLSKRFLSLAGISAGISLLFHSPVNLLTIIAPSLLILGLLPLSQTNLKKRLLYVLLFLSITLGVGSTGVYTTLLQTFLGSGTGSCTSPQCWGIYPKHLIVWMNPLILVIPLVSILLAIIFKFAKKGLSLSFVAPPAGALGVLVLYALFSYFKLINGISNVVFPTRVFWAGTLFSLLIACAAFSTIKRVLPKISFVISVVSLVVISLISYKYPVDIHKDFNSTDPANVFTYIVPKYQTLKLSELVPAWIPLNDINWRLDTFNSGLTQWWNFVATTPVVRGYSNHPTGRHQDWQYFLQSATREPEEEKEELVKNRALFLIDAYAIGFRENSIASWPKTILNDPKIIAKTESLRDFSWIEMIKDSPDSPVTPIVSASKAAPILIISDEVGYETLLRVLSLTGINSKRIIMVRGPQNLNSLEKKDLKLFPAIFLYRYKGENWRKIREFLDQGGRVFVELNETEDINKPKNLPDFFPINSHSPLKVEGSLNLQKVTQNEITDQVELDQFSPFTYNSGPWNLQISPSQQLQSGGEALLLSNENVVISKRAFGKGEIIVSGINLPFHVLETENWEEVKLYKNLIGFLGSFEKVLPNVEFSFARTKPEQIVVRGKDFRGVYFKENYDSGWGAQINGKKGKVYEAGLGFMYIPVNAPEEANVEINYKGNFTTWSLFILTLTSFIFSIIFILVPGVFYLLLAKVKDYENSVGARVRNWWIKEE